MSNTIYVVNISKNQTEKMISDFFSFCGKIINLKIAGEKEDSIECIIQFETETAAKTALLLSNALLGNKPIQVSPFNPNVSFSDTNNENNVNNINNNTNNNSNNISKNENITVRNFGEVQDHERSKTSVIAGLLASGYILSRDCIEACVRIDHENKYSEYANTWIEFITQKSERDCC